MSDEATPKEKKDTTEFSEQAEATSAGILHEFWDFTRQNNKLWLLPIIAFLLLAGMIAVLGGTSAAPFIYALF